MTGFGHYARCCWFAVWMASAITGTAFASGNDEETSLRATAAARVEMAFSAIDRAASLKALWIPAQEAADSARAAFERGDYELAIAQARTAIKLAELGIRQVDYPPYRHF